MRRYLKTLEEVVEVTADAQGHQQVRRHGDSMDVQLDRWRILQQERKERVVVIQYDLQAVHDPEPGSPGRIVNTMAVLYSHASDLAEAGVLPHMDPVEYAVYQEIRRTLDPRLLSGRVLFLCHSPLAACLRGADAEFSAAAPGEADPDEFGTNLYDLVVSDRALSYGRDPARIAASVKAALHRGGHFLAIENGYVAPPALRGFSIEGLRATLAGFAIRECRHAGNASTIAHKMASGGGWAPSREGDLLAGDDVWPAYIWMLGCHE